MTTDMTVSAGGRRFEHKGLGLVVELRPITQGLLNAWHAALRTATPAGDTALTEYHSYVVMAAITAGWVAAPAGWQAEAVVNWDPVKVRWLALRVLEVHKEVTTVPPE